MQPIYSNQAFEVIIAPNGATLRCYRGPYGSEAEAHILSDVTEIFIAWTEDQPGTSGQHYSFYPSWYSGDGPDSFFCLKGSEPKEALLEYGH